MFVAVFLEEVAEDGEEFGASLVATLAGGGALAGEKLEEFGAEEVGIGTVDDGWGGLIEGKVFAVLGDAGDGFFEGAGVADEEHDIGIARGEVGDDGVGGFQFGEGGFEFGFGEVGGDADEFAGAEVLLGGGNGFEGAVEEFSGGEDDGDADFLHSYVL